MQSPNVEEISIAITNTENNFYECLNIKDFNQHASALAETIIRPGNTLLHIRYSTELLVTMTTFPAVPAINIGKLVTLTTLLKLFKTTERASWGVWR